MKKHINKFIFLSLLIAIGFMSCNQDNEIQYYDTSLAPAYSLLQEAIVAELIPESGGILNVIVSRTDATNEATIPITISGSAGTLDLFKLKSTELKFEKGQSQVNAEIMYTLSLLSPSGSYTFTVALQDASSVSKGGYSKTEITAARRLTWNSIGTGYWEYSPMWGISDEPEALTVEQAIEAPELYRLVNFFSKPIMMKIDPATNVASISVQATAVSTANGELYMNCTGTYTPSTKIVNFPRVNAANPQNYYYTLANGVYTARYYLEERIKMP
jgi:hypothetical protein